MGREIWVAAYASFFSLRVRAHMSEFGAVSEDGYAAFAKLAAEVADEAEKQWMRLTLEKQTEETEE